MLDAPHCRFSQTDSQTQCVAPQAPSLRASCLSTAAALCLAALALAACGPKPDGAAAAGAPAGAASAPAAAKLLLSEVDLLTLQPSLLATGPVISGSLQPQRRSDLRAEMGGLVQQVLKDNGDSVAAGDLLVRLDDTSLRESLTSAQEALRASGQAMEQAERVAQRVRTLQAQGMSSVQALEDAEQRRVNLQSEVLAARARVATAQQQMRRTEVRAPFAGIVSERKVMPGDTASVGKELMKVIDINSLRFEGQVTAERMQELKPGQNVLFRVNGFGSGKVDQQFSGVVQRVDGTADAATRQVSVVVNFKDRAGAPQVAGLFAEGRIETGGAQALLLPDGALLRTGETVQAWRLVAGQGSQQINKVLLKLGPRDERSGLWPVLQGLTAGDRVLRSPGSKLRDGQAVEFSRTAVSPASAPAPASVPAAAAPASR